MEILVIDVGGTHIKVRATSHQKRVEFPSGPKMTARKMVAAVQRIIAGWSYDVITIGYPGLVLHGHILGEPHNLGHPWIGFDFKTAFGWETTRTHFAVGVGSGQMRANSPRQGRNMNSSENPVAFGAPGIEPRWTSSAKEGLGTAYS
jgi:hypothetical protein